MTENSVNQPTKRKTPSDASEFERQQLRFFLSGEDIAARLATINPSLAWLPVLHEMRFVQNGNQLIDWIERNFSDPDAIKEVVENLHFFSPEHAGLLEFRLNGQAGALSPLLLCCWRLILRSIRENKHGLLQTEWYELEPQIRRGEHSAALFEKIADTLRPKLKLSKRIVWGEERSGPPQHPTDFMSVDLEVDENLTADAVLEAWPKDTSADTDAKLLTQLTTALEAALNEAADVGLEPQVGYAKSDSDVPSVDQHGQNEYRSGFQAIVRTIADLWSRLSVKSPAHALSCLERWSRLDYRLIRRLALFAAANPIVSADVAARMLVEMPLGELFLTSASVEAYRLIRSRWHSFSTDDKTAVLKRLCEGPPKDWFRADAEIDQVIDRSLFDFLAAMVRDGFDVDIEAGSLLQKIKARWPNWQLRPEEQTGFHSWHSSRSGIVGDSGKFQSVVDDELIEKAGKFASDDDFMSGDDWQALCADDPDRALRGLDAAARSGSWVVGFWKSFLWVNKEYVGAKTAERTVELLLLCPQESFCEISDSASWWLNQYSKTLGDQLLWPLWDRIVDVSLKETEELELDDVYSKAINAPAGRLVEVLLKRLSNSPGKGEMAKDIQLRLNRLFDASGNCGKLARIRTSKDVSFLFERFPDWTIEKVIPLFYWTSCDAQDAWEARKYANYIGSPELFGLTKAPFLEMFGRIDMSSEELRVYASWLAAILIANKSRSNNSYPLAPLEARNALRRAGAKSLSSVGHRLAVEMENAKSDEKTERWRAVVGPVLLEIWPIDVDIRSNSANFKLIQILKATGAAFLEAADAIIPLLRPDEPKGHSTVFSVASAPDEIYQFSPSKVLEIVDVLVSEETDGKIYSLDKALNRIRGHDPSLANTRKFQRLLNRAFK
jgi:hypothetical protein